MKFYLRNAVIGAFVGFVYLAFAMLIGSMGFGCSNGDTTVCTISQFSEPFAYPVSGIYSLVHNKQLLTFAIVIAIFVGISILITYVKDRRNQ